MPKSISVLGSTGSIGVQTLDVARNLKIRVAGISANTNIDLLEEQIREFKPEVAAVGSRECASVLLNRIKGLGTEIYYGLEGFIKVATLKGVDIVVSSIVGTAGLLPTIEAIRKGKDIAIANKETLVTAGSIVMSEARKYHVKILPVDSEHSAIFQSLMGNNIEDVAKLILTASGGPFRNKSEDELEKVTVSEALRHPNWDMGSKITIDSATLMNKGLEVIEARWLFGLELDRIQVIIHPQSIIHSMVEYIDGSIIAQLGSPDMRLPIQFALTYPRRCGNGFSRLDLLKTGMLTFEEPDVERFPCLALAYRALQEGGTMPAVLNAANEVAVSLFLRGKIGFMDIPRLIAGVMDKHEAVQNPSIDEILKFDRWARDEVMKNFM